MTVRSSTQRVSHAHRAFIRSGPRLLTIEHNERRVFEAETQFKHPFSMTLAGNRRTGKTQFAKELLLKSRALIMPHPDKILWFYGTRQDDVFRQLQNALQQCIVFMPGLPRDGRTLQDVINDHSDRKLVILDDLMENVSNRKDVAALFTHGRHDDASVVFLSQNLFHKGKYTRDMSLNTDYMVLFKNVRDASVITHLGAQMGNTAFLQEAFAEATKDPFSHLLVDMHALTCGDFLFRSNALSDEIQYVYNDE